MLRYVLKRKDTENKWLRDRCEEIQLNPNDRLDLWAREHYKSTIITFAKTVQDILCSHGEDKFTDREITVGIFSHTRPMAKDFLKQIKREFEANTLLKELFPDIFYDDPKSQSPKWSEDEGLILKRNGNPKESTVEAWGLVDGQPTGKHFQLLIYDDIVTDRSVTTGDMIAKTTKALELSYNLGTDGGFRRFVGTIYDDADTWSVIIKRGTAKPRIYPATDNGKANGKPVFMSEEKLAEKVRDMGPYTFSCQMLLDPVPSDSAYFLDEYFIIEDDLPLAYSVIGCSDYAVTEDDGDYTEHGVFAIDQLGRPWILDWWSGQTRSDIWIETQLDLIKDWTPSVWVGESGPIRRAIEPFLDRRMEERGDYCRLEWLPSIADKAIRARPFQAIAAHYGIRMLRGRWNHDVIAQAKRFPRSTIDDKVDTLSLFGRALKETYAPLIPAIEQMNNPNDYGFNDNKGKDSWKTV